MATHLKINITGHYQPRHRKFQSMDYRKRGIKPQWYQMLDFCVSSIDAETSAPCLLQTVQIELGISLAQRSLEVT